MSKLKEKMNMADISGLIRKEKQTHHSLDLEGHGCCPYKLELRQGTVTD